MVEGGGLENRWMKVPWVRILLPPPKSIPVRTYKAHKPRWGAGSGGFYDFKYLSDEDFKKLATVLRVKRINNEIRPTYRR